jgi:hypothetical protein
VGERGLSKTSTQHWLSLAGRVLRESTEMPTGSRSGGYERPSHVIETLKDDRDNGCPELGCGEEGSLCGWRG